MTQDQAGAQRLLLGTHRARSREPNGGGFYKTIDFPIPDSDPDSTSWEMGKGDSQQ